MRAPGPAAARRQSGFFAWNRAGWMVTAGLRPSPDREPERRAPVPAASAAVTPPPAGSVRRSRSRVGRLPRCPGVGAGQRRRRRGPRLGGHRSPAEATAAEACPARAPGRLGPAQRRAAGRLDRQRRPLHRRRRAAEEGRRTAAPEGAVQRRPARPTSRRACRSAASTTARGGPGAGPCRQRACAGARGRPGRASARVALRVEHADAALADKLGPSPAASPASPRPRLQALLTDRWRPAGVRPRDGDRGGRQRASQTRLMPPPPPPPPPPPRDHPDGHGLRRAGARA